MVSKTKLDCYFPNAQFVIEGYIPPFGTLLFVREDINKSLPKDFEGFFIELNLRKKKSLVCSFYSRHKSNIANH